MSSGLISGKIIADLFVVERMKRHIGADGKNAFAMRAQVHQADAGDDLMRPALQPRQHPSRFGEIARLAENFAFQKDQRVRAEHERVGDFLGHGARLAVGVKLAKFQRRQMFVENLRRVAGHDFEIPVSTGCSNSARRGDAEARMSGGSFTRPI